jgi:hypothetical protein
MGIAGVIHERHLGASVRTDMPGDVIQSGHHTFSSD